MAPGTSKTLSETVVPATNSAAVAPASAAAPGAVPASTAAAAHPGNAAIKGLMQKGMNQGMNQLLKSGTTKKLEQLIK